MSSPTPSKKPAPYHVTKTIHLYRSSKLQMASSTSTSTSDSPMTKPAASVSTSSGSSSGSSTVTTTPEHPSPELSVASTSYVVPPRLSSSDCSPSPSRLSHHHPHFPHHDPSYYHTQTSIDSSPPPYTEATNLRAGSASTSRLHLAQSQDEISVDSFKPQAENHVFPPSSRYQPPLPRPQSASSSRTDHHSNNGRRGSFEAHTLATGAVAKEKRLGHRRVNPEGEVTYKNIQSSQIMYSIQLGIGHSVGSLASKPERDVLYNDFNQVETIAFPKSGSQTTPAHHYSDFEFITYTPNAFRHFRDLFRIQPDDFMLSITNGPLQELSNPGASGSVFYRTNDDQFVIKTVEKNESKFLLKLLPGYYMNLSQNPRTLLPKFFGLYTYECTGKNIRLIVMNNLLPSYIKLHEKYDLKGSTYKRKASDKEREKTSPTFKDLDFLEKYHLMDRFSRSNASLAMSAKESDSSGNTNGTDGSYEETDFGGLQLEAHIYDELMNTLQRDCRVLESFEIMDYSLLVGVHNYDRFNRERDESNYLDFDYDNDDELPTGAIRAQNHKGERLLLFVGIIDILQSYRLFKRVEHAWKALLHDGDTISVHRPKFYAKRFLNFMQKYVFGRLPAPPELSKNDKYSHYYQVAEHQKKYGFNSLNRNFLGPNRQFGTQFR